MKHYCFQVFIGAEANSIEEAWEDAVSCFALDPGEPKTWSEEELED